MPFCGCLLVQQPAEVEYFDRGRDWPQPNQLSEQGQIITRAIQSSYSSPSGRCRSFCQFAASALRLDRPPGVSLWVTNKNNQCRLLDCSQCGNLMVVVVLLAFIINVSHPLESHRPDEEYFMAISAVAEPPSHNQNAFLNNDSNCDHCIERQFLLHKLRSFLPRCGPVSVQKRIA